MVDPNAPQAQTDALTQVINPNVQALPLAYSVVDTPALTQGEKSIFDPLRSRIAVLGGTIVAGLGAVFGAANAGAEETTPPIPRHYMKFGGAEYRKLIHKYQRECPEGLTVTPTHKRQIKARMGKLTMQAYRDGEANVVRSTFKKSRGAKVCGALAFTGNRKYVFVPEYDENGVFVDVSQPGDEGVSMISFNVRRRAKV